MFLLTSPAIACLKFNLSILECKVEVTDAMPTLLEDLIYPYWNVKLAWVVIAIAAVII